MAFSTFLHFGVILLLVVVFLVLVLFVFWKFWFLRDPGRAIPAGDVIVSPADGKIIAIVPFDVRDGNIVAIPKAFFGGVRSLVSEVAGEGVIVSIFMSPLDVHVNRSPMDGTVIRQEHTPGRFHGAYDFPISLVENEKNEIVIEGSYFSIKVIQIAGALARRIESFISTGDCLSKGQKIGRINLGSQCTLILPKRGVTLRVQKGERVYAGSSIIATVDVSACRAPPSPTC